MAGKRGNSEGTIRKRGDGRWEARYVDLDGNRRSLYCKTRQEVVRLLAQAIRDREQGITALTERQTMGQYLASWLETVKHAVKAGSYVRYEQVVRLHLMPDLGNVPLAKLTAQHVKALYAKKLGDGSSSALVRYMHVLLHSALDGAVRLGLVLRNVADMVDKPRKRHHEVSILSESEARALIATASGDRLEALVVLALATGMRQGELFALKWADVDLESGWLQVRATLRRLPDGLVFQEPKTAKSRRRVALSPAVIETLRRHRLRQVEERLHLGEAWSDLDLVFPNTVGGPYEWSVVYRWFRPLLARAGLPRIRFHDLRHTAATLLLSRGVNPKVVSEMLGHSNIAITLGIYGHVLPHMQQQAASVMDTTLFG